MIQLTAFLGGMVVAAVVVGRSAARQWPSLERWRRLTIIVGITLMALSTLIYVAAALARHYL